MPLRRPLAAFALLALSALPLRAAGIDTKIPTEESIQALQERAILASPHEQCFLYAEIVHEMTELSARQYAAGEPERATSLLKKIQEFAHKIHLSLGADNRRLKDAQILLRHTAFRLTELLHNSSYEDHDLVAQTLALVNKTENEAMMQVLRK